MTTRKHLIVVGFLFALVLGSFAQQSKPATAASAPAQPIKVSVDATHAPEKILHAQLQIPVTGGPKITLVYPKWIPGEHGPTGPIVDLTGLKFFANGQRVTWRRDLDDMYTFHLTLPSGVDSVDATLDLVMPAPPEGFSSGASATAQLDMLSWNQVVLYQPGKHTDDIPITASLKLPAGWHYGTPLPVQSESNGQINFQTVSLTSLLDSPHLTTAHFLRISLPPAVPLPHQLH